MFIVLLFLLCIPHRGVDGLCEVNFIIPAEGPLPYMSDHNITEYNYSVVSNGSFPRQVDDASLLLWPYNFLGPGATCKQYASFCDYPDVAQICPTTCNKTSWTREEMMGRIATMSPQGSGPFPLYVWIMGQFHCAPRVPASFQMMWRMRQHGFFGAAIEPPFNFVAGGYPEKGEIIAKGIIGKMLCNYPQVDCSLGIAASAYSAGGMITLQLPKHEPRITAVLCQFSGDGKEEFGIIYRHKVINKYFPKNRIRLVSVDLDEIHSHRPAVSDDYSLQYGLATSKKLTGYDCGPLLNCIQSDGSGYVMVPTDVIVPAYGNPCPTHNAPFNSSTWRIQDWWMNGRTGTELWRVEAGISWLAEAARKPKNAAPTAVPYKPKDAEEPETTSNAQLCWNIIIKARIVLIVGLGIHGLGN